MPLMANVMPKALASESAVSGDLFGPGSGRIGNGAQRRWIEGKACRCPGILGRGKGCAKPRAFFEPAFDEIRGAERTCFGRGRPLEDHSVHAALFCSEVENP